MSQPRRRRRRGRRRTGSSAQPDATPTRRAGQDAASAANPAEAAADRGGRRRRRRRGRGGGQPAISSPKSSEDIFRTERPRPQRVGAAADGRTLETVIGELQSAWGVPQNPQEYRITLRVAEERDARGERVATVEETIEDPSGGNGHPRREKAPAAPRMGGVVSGAGEEGPPPTRRRRSRRRRRRKG